MTGARTSGGMLAIGVMLAIGAAGAAAASLSVVPENMTALIVRGDTVNAVVNPVTATPATIARFDGVAWHVPLIDTVERFDRRTSTIALADLAVVTADRGRVKVDAYLRVSIADPLKLRASGGELQAKRRLAAAYAELLSTAYANQPLLALTGAGDEGEQNPMLAPLQLLGNRFGIRVVDAGIVQTKLAPATRDAMLSDMRRRLRLEAASVEQQGIAQVRAVQQQANADISRIYAETYGRDPQFYAFYRAMQSYMAIFAGEGDDKTTIILPAGEGYLSQMHAP